MLQRLFFSSLLIAGIAVVGCIGDAEVEPVPRVEAHFTQPQPGEPDETIEEVLLELLEDAPSDSTVRAAIYTISRENVAEALGDAHDRGVDVQVVLGNTNESGFGEYSAVTILRERLGDRLTICNEDQNGGGCMGDGIQHNKFVTFSEVGDLDSHVVFQSSANLTDFQLDLFNNAVVAYNDRSLYEAFTSYWDDLESDETNLSYDRIEEGDQATTAYFFPHSDGDPILEALHETNCEDGGEVYVAMAYFTDTRSEIAFRLRNMDTEGCSIHVLIRDSDLSSSPGNAIKGNLQNGDIDLGNFPDEADVQLHSKYMAIDAAYGPDGEQRQVVWTGSQNYTGDGLRSNDEVVLEIHDDALFEAFRDDWNHMRSRAETLHP